MSKADPAAFRKDVRYTEWTISQIEGPQDALPLLAILEDAFSPERQAANVTVELTNLDDRHGYPAIVVKAEYPT